MDILQIEDVWKETLSGFESLGRGTKLDSDCRFNDKYLSPDGKFLLSFGLAEIHMGDWIESICIKELESNKTMLDCGHRWDARYFEFFSDGCLYIRFFRYPRIGAAVYARVDLKTWMVTNNLKDAQGCDEWVTESSTEFSKRIKRIC